MSKLISFFSTLFSKQKKDVIITQASVSGISEDSNSSPEIQSLHLKNWFEERYDNIIVQRNLLFATVLVLLCLSIVSVSVFAYVVNSKSFDPFVIQIDEATGMAKVVTPLNNQVLTGDESLAKYFIKKYVISRETYNPVDFDTLALKNVRLLSSNSVYWGYRGMLRNDEINPSKKYGQKNTTYLTVKSWSKISDNKFFLRFSLHETSGNRRAFDKIAVVEFKYTAMELTEEERDVNPVGFQVTGYRVDDDNS
jgi:type IV secretion system protein VirB8